MLQQTKRWICEEFESLGRKLYSEYTGNKKLLKWKHYRDMVLGLLTMQSHVRALETIMTMHRWEDETLSMDGSFASSPCTESSKRIIVFHLKMLSGTT